MSGVKTEKLDIRGGDIRLSDFYLVFATCIDEDGRENGTVW